MLPLPVRVRDGQPPETGVTVGRNGDAPTLGFVLVLRRGRLLSLCRGRILSHGGRRKRSDHPDNHPNLRSHPRQSPPRAQARSVGPTTNDVPLARPEGGPG